jgi:hypothetical protein
MKSLSRGTILFSAFVLASPTLMFGRGEPGKTYRYIKTAVPKSVGHTRDMGARAGGKIYPTTATPDRGSDRRLSPPFSAFGK